MLLDHNSDIIIIITIIVNVMHIIKMYRIIIISLPLSTSLSLY